MRPITLLPLAGQELFHVVAGKMPRRCIVMYVFDSGEFCSVAFSTGTPWPKTVSTIDLYEML